MIDFKIKQIEEGKFDYDIKEDLEVTESFAQRVILVINTWKNEFLYDENKGIDYLSLFKGETSSTAIESFFIYALEENLFDFDFLTEFTLSWSPNRKTAYISFTAHSKTKETATIENYEI